MGWPLCAEAAAYAAYTLWGSWPPRFRRQMSSSDMLATMALSSGYLPKKCSRTYAPSRLLNFWYSPSTASSMRLSSSPPWSRAMSGSQYEPQITLSTFQPAPRKSASSSWMILPLPRTGPSRRCRLQLMTNTRLSSPSRAAMPMAPSDSGSSISPSPMKAQTRRPAVFAWPRSSR